MIPPDRHTREWITAQQAQLGMADPIILEKANRLKSFAPEVFFYWI